MADGEDHINPTAQEAPAAETPPESAAAPTASRVDPTRFESLSIADTYERMRSTVDIQIQHVREAEQREANTRVKYIELNSALTATLADLGALYDLVTDADGSDDRLKLVVAIVERRISKLAKLIDPNAPVAMEDYGLNEFQAASYRTMSKSQGPQEKLINFGLGVAGEAGEVADYIKKVICHGHPLDAEKIIYEMGDVLWYLALGAEVLGTDLAIVARKNVEKLAARYPEGFTVEASINRASEAQAA